MVGRHKVVVAKLQAKRKNLHSDSSFTHFYCIIHQQNLCSNIIKLDHVLSSVTKAINYIRGRSLNHREFSQLLEDKDYHRSSILHRCALVVMSQCVENIWM